MDPISPLANRKLIIAVSSTEELNALFDLIIGIKIGKSFIGLKESTFSDTLAHYICNPTLIGMDIN